MAAQLPGDTLAQGSGDRGPIGARGLGPTFVAGEAVEAVAIALAETARKTFAKPKRQGLLRWGYVLPRLAVALVLVGLVRYGLDPALKWAITASGEAALGAKVEIGELRTTLRGGRLEIRDFAAAHPAKEMRNLVEAGAGTFAIDVAELCRGRLRVVDGRVTGIAFDGERTVSGALSARDKSDADAGPSMFDPLVDAAVEHGGAWFDDVSSRLESDLESQLQTPAVARDLEARWPQEYAELRSVVDDLQVRGKRLEAAAKELKKNPLRNLAATEQLAADVAAIDRQAKELHARLETLPKQAEADRKAIDAARKHDERFLREQAAALKKLDGDQLSRYLLGDEAHGYVETTLAWVETARALVPKKRPSAKPPKRRGVTVVFADRPRPAVLVERVELLGSARLDGRTLELAGLLTHATSHPHLHPEPARLALRGSGAQEFTLEATLDRRSDVAHDTLVFHCPQLPLPGRTLGKAEKIAVEVAPGTASLAAHVELVGDRIEGTVQYLQGMTRLTASTPAVRDAGLEEALNESLANLARIEAKLVLSGTTRRPRFELTSNLGPDLAAGFDRAFRAYLTDKSNRIVAKAQAKVDEQVAKLDGKRRAAQDELLAKLGDNQELLAQLGGLAGGELPSIVTLPGGKTVSTDVNAAAAGAQTKATKAATAKLGELQQKLLK
ncbi:MAG: TIGR03545 family protein [Pirellulales bacterium]|nr:TIGR03545 family protein [Pirellulales bacterium]